MKLTIGMIVRNEHDNLPRCLESIKPVLEQVDSELIVVDTGSIDDTKDIAKSYGAKVIDFRWCDDFAAARNAGLDAANGEWFWYPDADHEMIDISELIDFFNSGKYNNYEMAGIPTCNFLDLKNEQFSISNSIIMFKINNNRFMFPIHEVAVTVNENVYMFNDFKILHYGHVNCVNAEKIKRNNRILELWKEQELRESEPCLNGRLYRYLAQGYFELGDYNKSIEIIHEFNRWGGLRLRSTSDYKMDLIEIKSLIKCGKIRESSEKINSLINSENKEFISGYLLGLIINIQEYVEIISNVTLFNLTLKCLNEYDKFKRLGNNDKSKIFFSDAFSVFNSVESIGKIINLLNRIEYKDLMPLFDELYEKLEFEVWPLEKEIELMHSNNDFSRIKIVYLKALDLHYEEDFINLINSYRTNDIVIKKLTIELAKTDKITTFVRACCFENRIGSWENFNVKINDADYIYYAYYRTQELEDIVKNVIDKNNKDNYAKIIQGMATNNKFICYANENIDLLLNRELNDKEYNFFNLYFQLCLNTKDNIIKDLYIKYVRVIGGYLVKNKIEMSDSMLLEKSLTYAYKGLISIDNREFKKALGEINQAIKCNCFSEYLVDLLDEINNKIDAENNEFNSYARQVKDTIIKLVASNQDEEAISLFMQYKKIAPNDHELDEIFISE